MSVTTLKQTGQALTFVVWGHPEPGGSKRAFRHASTGKTIVTDANRKAKPWMAQVRIAAVEAVASVGGVFPLIVGPVKLEVTFVLSRPKGHYGTGRNAQTVRASAPAWPTTRPDTTKLLRALEDALTGVLWRDDAQVVKQEVCKEYDDPERAVVTVRPLLATYGAITGETA